MCGTFLQGKLERYGGAVVFVKTRQTCPSVSVGDIIQDRSGDVASQDENGHLDSWTVGDRRSPPLVSTLLCCDAFCRRVTSGNERGSTLLPAALPSHRVSTVSRGCLYRVTALFLGRSTLHWYSAWLVDFLRPPTLDIVARPLTISMIAGQN